MPRNRETPEAWDGFSPLRPAPRGKRVAVFVLGPLAWVVALAVLVRILRNDRAVEIGLLVALVSFVVALALLVLARSLHAREEPGR